jgi:hypothetical protein
MRFSTHKIHSIKMIEASILVNDASYSAAASPAMERFFMSLKFTESIKA